MNKIINILKNQKSIPIDQFISLALYDKKFGYYMKENPFGKKGDYITSPLVTTLFSEMIAIWCVAFWESLGKPKKILIVELGPGDGTLCKDLVIALSRFEDFYNCLNINLLEKSNNLIKIQKNKIKNKKVRWIKKINEINHGPIIFLGNEFFDSLPIKQIYIKKKLFFEKHVSLTKNKNKMKFLYKKANSSLIKDIKKFSLNTNQKIIEYPLKAIKYLEIISKKINKYDGGLLIFDYGYMGKKDKDTLRSIKGHKFVNIFSTPGKADITSDINYKLFVEILSKNNLHTQKIVSQNEFLQKMGIIKRAELLSKNISFKEKANMFFRLKKLLHYNEMGKLFKVMFAQKKNKNFSLGF